MIIFSTFYFPSLSVLQLEIPVQIISPGIGHTPGADSDHKEGNPVGLDGLLSEPETHLPEGLAPFYPITLVTGRNDISPFRPAPISLRGHMIEREVLGFKFVPAVLT